MTSLLQYEQRLMAHTWPYRPGAPDYEKHGHNEVELINEARSGGDDFKRLFNQHYQAAHGIPFFKDFPVATTANEQHPKQTYMKIELNITGLESLEAAFNRIAAALELKANGVTTAPSEAPPAPATEEQEAPAPAPKKEKKAKPAPAPTPEPEPEPETPAEPEFDANELADKMKPLAGTPFSIELKDYKEKLTGSVAPLRTITDQEILRKLNTKIEALLALQAEGEV